MIKTSKTTGEWQTGFVVLTSVDTERPVVIHVDDFYGASFEVDGGMPSTVSVQHMHDGHVVATMVFERLPEVVRMFASASHDQRSSEELKGEREHAFRGHIVDPEAF